MKTTFTTKELDLLQKQFEKEYDFLYKVHSEGAKVAGEDEALTFGDRLIDEHDPLVSAFSHHRCDFLTSDREVMAFAFAVVQLGWR